MENFKSGAYFRQHFWGKCSPSFFDFFRCAGFFQKRGEISPFPHAGSCLQSLGKGALLWKLVWYYVWLAKDFAPYDWFYLIKSRRGVGWCTFLRNTCSKVHQGWVVFLLFLKSTWCTFLVFYSHLNTYGKNQIVHCVLFGDILKFYFQLGFPWILIFKSHF